MIEFPYYIVYRMIKDANGNKFPEFFNCVLRDGVFYKIDSLQEYLKNGNGISSQKINEWSAFSLIKEINYKLKFLM